MNVQRSLNITFRGMEPSPAVEARIREKVAWLERSFDRIVGCDVVVEAPPQHPRKGGLFAVTVELRVPGGPPIFAGRAHDEDHGHEDVYTAIRDSFEAVRRQLVDRFEILRGDVKAHAGQRNRR